jgi:phenylalanyl-tRNA synthetase alpha chain
MLDRLQQIRDETLSRIAEIESSEALGQLESAIIGRKGEVTTLLRSIGQLPPEQRPAAGKYANEVQAELQAVFNARAQALGESELVRELQAGALDVTLPGRRRPVGRLHPATLGLRQIYSIWAEMGFQVFLSRDVEDDETNFTLLNIPPHHPARDMWDTFHTSDRGVILRTHTSPGQIRAMHTFAPEPIRVILPGMVYRYEQIDATHEIQFNQVEGLAVGRGIRFTDLKGTMIAFARRVYGEDRRVRFRCSHFPFTEPSVEVDFSCHMCGGSGVSRRSPEGEAGCRVCKQSGWIEIAGAGLVNPKVFEAVGYDPEEVTGYAFGMGVERIAMILYGVPDIRMLYENDVRFLKQF